MIHLIIQGNMRNYSIVFTTLKIVMFLTKTSEAALISIG